MADNQVSDLLDELEAMAATLAATVEPTTTAARPELFIDTAQAAYMRGRFRAMAQASSTIRNAVDAIRSGPVGASLSEVWERAYSEIVVALLAAGSAGRIVSAETASSNKSIGERIGFQSGCTDAVVMVSSTLFRFMPDTFGFPTPTDKLDSEGTLYRSFMARNGVGPGPVVN